MSTNLMKNRACALSLGGLLLLLFVATWGDEGWWTLFIATMVGLAIALVVKVGSASAGWIAWIRIGLKWLLLAAAVFLVHFVVSGWSLDRDTATGMAVAVALLVSAVVAEA